ncbi:hypothetical protein CHUAL_004969 [Chamberlinius hualienensis]
MESRDRLSVIRKHVAASNSANEWPNNDFNLISTGRIVQSNECSGKVNREEQLIPVTDSNGFKTTIPKKRQDAVRWNGWGYKDSGFVISGPQRSVSFQGDRYGLGSTSLPNFNNFAWNYLKVDFKREVLAQEQYREDDVPLPVINDEFMRALEHAKIPYSKEAMDRVTHSHGQTIKEMFILQKGIYDRICDLVVWPECHDDVVKLVQIATECNVVLIPIGGGTSVSGALLCPSDETRMIVSLDTTQMCKILWIDEENMKAHIEAGIVGQDLEKLLNAKGFCTGHEPDSLEFSTLGGWVATRASGMKKNIYGNIEDMVIHVTLVTPTGVVSKSCEVPRMSCGPDIHHFILGSEGTLGVITEVTIKIHHLPECRKYGSIVFATFEEGVACLREVAKQRCAPASIRLMDNDQFQFGLAVKPGGGSAFSSVSDIFKKFYLTRIKGVDLKKLSVATLLFEGRPKDVEIQEKRIFEIAQRFGGFSAGEENGRRGYMLTYVIAYIRDLALRYSIVAESFETSVPWDRVIVLSRNVKERITDECRKRGIDASFVSCRVTQTYDAGACIYFYFGYNYEKVKHPVEVYEEIETLAREEVLANGGSISHHHGVGKIRKQWLQRTISKPGVEMLRAIKQSVDPQNIFSNGNLML